MFTAAETEGESSCLECSSDCVPPCPLPGSSTCLDQHCPSPFVAPNLAAYAHSPVHSAVAARDHTGLRRLLATVPRPPPPERVRTEQQALAAEVQADAAARVLDRRDVAGKETALCLAVRLGDAEAAEMLLEAGASVSLQNAGGWTALQEAVCRQQLELAATLLQHSQLRAWQHYQRRLPALAAILSRMADFYMELHWAFESPVLPFLARIAPSDTYRIWKRGARLRADITLAGFDGFRVKRRPQSILFLPEGASRGGVPCGSASGSSSSSSRSPACTLVVLHRAKQEAFDALEEAAHRLSRGEAAAEARHMLRTGVFRAGFDVAKAELTQLLSWRGVPRTEVVSGYKTGLYEMQGVAFRMKLRRVAVEEKGKGGSKAPEEKGRGSVGADARQMEEEREGDKFEGEEEEEDEEGDGVEQVGLEGALTEEERKQLQEAMEEGRRASELEVDAGAEEEEEAEGKASGNVEDKPGRRGWFGWGKSSSVSKEQEGAERMEQEEEERRRKEETSGQGGSEASQAAAGAGRGAPEGSAEGQGPLAAGENEFRRGLKPLLWLTRDFPLDMAELLPLLDLLASRVKAVQRLKEVLVLKLPPGMVPVKVAIPVVPTVRVQVTFSKFQQQVPSFRAANAEEAAAFEEPSWGGEGEGEQEEGADFHTPTGSPQREGPGEEGQRPQSWLEWMRRRGGSTAAHSEEGASAAEGVRGQEDEEDVWAEDPFVIPPEYRWLTVKELKRRQREKRREQRQAARASKHTSKKGAST